MGTLTAATLGDRPTATWVTAGRPEEPRHQRSRPRTRRARVAGHTAALGGPPRQGVVARRGRQVAWYGADVVWQCHLERGVRAAFYGDVAVSMVERDALTEPSAVLVYDHAGVDLPGRTDPVPLRIEFHEVPPYETYGLAPQDYPRVFADPGLASEHRMPDDALCLYFPRDPPQRRWCAEDGLVALIDLARNHLYFEMRWRDSGAHHGGIWLGDEAPHGFLVPRRRR